jgi:hypothetical protein
MSVQTEEAGDQVAPMLVVGPVMGLDMTTAPFRVAPTNVIDCQNLTPNATYGSYETALGRTSMGVLPGPINGFTKFIRPGVPDTYIFAVDFGGIGTLWHGPINGPYVQFATPVPLTPGLNSQFVFSYQWCFFNNSVDIPLKIDLDLNVTYWGIVPPDAAPILTADGAADMNGTYYYIITFGSVTPLYSIESSEGPDSLPITVTGTGVTLTGIPVSPDPQVTERNIYRIGGSQGQFFLVGTIPDNVTTTFTDTLADNLIGITPGTGQLLTPQRDPPLPFLWMCTHQERIWGWGSATDPSIVYYSNLDEPTGFDLYVAGYIVVGENSFNDGANGMSSEGSVLILNKDRTVYAVYGSSNADFQAIKLADTGCRSGLSVATLDGVTAWINRRGIWFCSGTTPQNMSDGAYQVSNIKSFILSLTDADLDQAVGWWYDRMYHISFPTLNVTYFFDLRGQGWWRLGWATDHVYVDVEANELPSNGVALQVLGVNLQTIGEFDQWFTGGTDLGLPIMAYLTSRVTDGGDSATEKIIRFGEVIAPPQPGMVFLTCIANPGTFEIFNQIGFNLADELRHQESWPQAMRGSEVQLQLRTFSSVQIQIESCTIYAYVDRKLIQDIPTA